MKTWYILLRGESVDGRGFPEYFRRTTDKSIAREYYKDCYNNQHSMGQVWIFTDSERVLADYFTDWDKY